jgi:hypothetical protein
MHCAGLVHTACAGLSLALLAAAPAASTAAAEAAPALPPTSPSASTPSPASLLAHDIDSGLTLQALGLSVQVVDRQGRVLQRWTTPASVLPVLLHRTRRSFIVAPRGVAQLWEMALDPQAPPLYEGMVHDYRMGEGLARPGYLGLRRTPLQRPLQAVCGCGAQPYLRVWEAGADGSAVLHLDVRRIIARCAPESGSAATDSGNAPAASHPGCGCPVCPPR